MRITGLSYLRELCIKEDKMVRIQNKNNMFVQHMRRAMEEYGHNTCPYTIIRYESEIEKDYSKEDQNNGIDRFSKIDEFINHRLCRCYEYTQEQLDHLIIGITHDYAVFNENSKNIEHFYLPPNRKLEDCADEEDIFGDRIKFLKDVLVKHEMKKLERINVALGEARIKKYIKFRFCITSDLSYEGQMFMDFHTRQSYLRFCHNSIIDEKKTTSTPLDNNRRKRVRLSDKERKKNSQNREERKLPMDELFNAVTEENPEKYRWYQRARIAILFKHMIKMNRELLEMKGLNEMYEHPSAACARIDHTIATAKNSFEEKSEKIITSLKTIEDKLEGRKIDKPEFTIENLSDPNSTLLDNEKFYTRFEVKQKKKEFYMKTRISEMLRGEIKISNDENEKKGTGKFCIIVYSKSRPDHIGQVSQIMNERKGGKEKEIFVCGYYMWYKTKHLSIIKDRYRVFKRYYHRPRDLSCVIIIKSSNPGHVEKLAFIRNIDYEYNMVKVRIVESGHTVWYHMQCLKRHWGCGEEDSSEEESDSSTGSHKSNDSSANFDKMSTFKIMTTEIPKDKRINNLSQRKHRLLLTKITEILRDITINNDENEKKRIGQYAIVIYASEPDIIGQVSEILNERKNGHYIENEIKIFGKIYWYRTERLAIIQDYPEFKQRYYGNHSNFKNYKVIKSSNPDHIGKTGKVEEDDFERNCVKLRFKEGFKSAWYHTQCLEHTNITQSEDFETIDLD